MFALRIWPVAVGFLCAAVPSGAATTTTATHWLYSFEMLPSSSGSSIRTSTSSEVVAHFHRQGLIRLAQGAGVVPGYLGGLSRSRPLCLQLSSHLPHHPRACLALREQEARLNR